MKSLRSVTSYLSQPTTVVLSTFPLITLPLFIWTFYAWRSPALSWVLMIFFYTFGLSHFFATLFIYLSSENRAYFSESKKNQLIYLFVPVLIFVYFGFEGSLPFQKYAWGAAISGFVFKLVRAANFTHGTRQSYGVLQLMKRHFGLASPSIGIHPENFLFLSLALLQFQTRFIGHNHFSFDGVISKITLLVSLLFFALVVRNYFFHPARSRKTAAMPFAYLMFQAFACAATIYDMRFFIASSAVHYVEYHFLMVSRFSGFKANQTKWSDRVLAQATRLPVIFIGINVVIGVLYGYFRMGRGRLSLAPVPNGLGFTLGLVDGIFLFHYFLEAFIWRIRSPFYKRTIQFPFGARSIYE